MARLFTVVVSVSMVRHAGRHFALQSMYECDFAGKHFSRESEEDLIKWVRVAARHVYGASTQVIFLHEQEGTDQ